MDKQIDRAMMRKNPELASDLHLPMLARVEAISDPILTVGLSEQFRPRYAVDVRLLDENDQPDPMMPLLRAVPLPASCAGLERGVYGFPEPGAIVELAFAYGLQNKPFIRTILTDGLSVPELLPGELLLQSAHGVSMRADIHGNWSRDTHADIRDSALLHEIKSLLARVETDLHHVKVEQHSSEEIGGIKAIEALGAVKIFSGGAMHLGALTDIEIVTAKNQKNKIAGDLIQRVGKISESFALVKQVIKVKDGGTVWLGSEVENVLKILSDLIQVVSDIAATAKDHTHTYTDNGSPLKTKKPDQSGDFGSAQGSADGIKGRLDPIVEK